MLQVSVSSQHGQYEAHMFLVCAAFNSSTGMPYGTVNLLHGVPAGETPVTCTAGVGTFLLEFGALSRLTGDPVFEKTARRAMDALWAARSEIGLVSSYSHIASSWLIIGVYSLLVSAVSW